MSKALINAIQIIEFSESAKYQLVSESAKHFSSVYKTNAIQAANDLIENFPDNPLSYGQMAHTLHITGGDKKKVMGHLEQCLKLDKETEYCKVFLEKLTRK